MSYNLADFTLSQLTDAVNVQPPLDLFLSRFFTTGRLSKTSLQIERGETGLNLIDPTARGSVSPTATGAGRTRSLMNISSVKLGRVIEIAASDIQDVRAFGSEDQEETLDTVINEQTGTVRRWIDYSNENLRFGTVKGKQLASDGTTVIFDFYAAAGIAEPTPLDIALATATRKELQEFFSDSDDHVRTGLGVEADMAQDVVIVYGKTAWRNFRENDAVASLYDRYQEGAVNRQSVGGKREAFELFNVKHVPYYGASIGDDEWRAIPVMPGLFQTKWTPLDNPETANTLGLPFYATPEVLPYGKGLGVELASLPLHYVTRPEALIGGSDTTV
ncbi:hypothetical protein BMI91_19630 [Thioclava sediminum]|uniref:Major capsid protein n=1 Tax=Thioclava sediminum TaxID=1915319 RepID=A0ABX3MS21_9RHOB|nr:major capsid protein [Thioclava sediminum]OOY22495.1 hypothetical protein BMI91_19630 [Thioclava sediminum]